MPRRLTLLLAALLTVLVGVPGRAGAANVVTPGNFTGYGFDQCLAPTQHQMNVWLRSSPYWAVGIYISGDSRGCTSQPNLTPHWVSAQLRKGWRLLPITLGPQAWCTTRERYLHQVRIDPHAAHDYSRARKQGRQEARKSVGVARSLGIAAGSTLWYDIEAFDINGTDCRESALSFLSAWTTKLHGLDYVSGVYSSAASGIAMLDDAHADRPGVYANPDQIWIGDWNGVADVHSSYVRDSSWMPHRRVHQYRGGHAETYDGVAIDVDNDWVDLGRGSVAGRAPQHCGGVSLDALDYPPLRYGASGARVEAAQCALHEKGGYDGPIDGAFDDGFARAVRAYKVAHGLQDSRIVSRRTWGVVLAQGPVERVKVGAAGAPVRRLQRALDALVPGTALPVSGVFGRGTLGAVVDYQARLGLTPNGVVNPSLWRRLQRGQR